MRWLQRVCVFLLLLCPLTSAEAVKTVYWSVDSQESWERGQSEQISFFRNGQITIGPPVTLTAEPAAEQMWHILCDKPWTAATHLQVTLTPMALVTATSISSRPIPTAISIRLLDMQRRPVTQVTGLLVFSINPHSFHPLKGSTFFRQSRASSCVSVRT